MGNLNKVFLIGRLGKDPESRTIKGTSGKSVLNITLASSEFYKDGTGNKKERTEWHRVVLWDKLSDIVTKFCQKGSQIYIEGSLQTREWKDKEGNRRFTTEIIGKNVQLLDPKTENNAPAQEPKKSNYPSSYGDPDGEIPF